MASAERKEIGAQIQGDSSHVLLGLVHETQKPATTSMPEEGIKIIQIHIPDNGRGPSASLRILVDQGGKPQFLTLNNLDPRWMDLWLGALAPSPARH